MPTYEYECTKCGHRFERFQRITEEPVKRCPKCRCKVRRLLGAGAGILFKGGGFYETDYRSDSYKQAAKKEQAAAKPAAAGKKDSGKAGAGQGGKAAAQKTGGA
ncbi:MAG: zinc ribbon domain-containing protein [Lentisphaerae bacterium]|nr:zinc ribbon domain-containing protein [Lentisphaerota bacterium]